MHLSHAVRPSGKRQHNLWVELGVIQAVVPPNQYSISDVEIPLAPICLCGWTAWGDCYPWGPLSAGLHPCPDRCNILIGVLGLLQLLWGPAAKQLCVVCLSQVDSLRGL